MSRRVLIENAKEIPVKAKPAMLPVSLFAAEAAADGTLARWMAPVAGTIEAIVIKIEELKADEAALELAAKTGAKTVSIPFKAKAGNNLVADTLDVAAGDTVTLRVCKLSLKGTEPASIGAVYTAFMLRPRG